MLLGFSCHAPPRQALQHLHDCQEWMWEWSRVSACPFIAGRPSDQGSFLWPPPRSPLTLQSHSPLTQVHPSLHLHRRGTRREAFMYHPVSTSTTPSVTDQRPTRHILGGGRGSGPGPSPGPTVATYLSHLPQQVHPDSQVQLSPHSQPFLHFGQSTMVSD